MNSPIFHTSLKGAQFGIGCTEAPKETNMIKDTKKAIAKARECIIQLEIVS
jgi:hypothetical protein